MIIEQKVCGRINGYNSFGNPIGLKIDEMWSFVGNKKKSMALEMKIEHGNG
jgi:hypothetical protein